MSIRNIALLGMLFAGTTLCAWSQGDNRYCGPGDVPHFGAEKDGPAALPTRCISTSLASTPSRGKTIRVSGRTDLPAVIEKAACGDTIMLEAGGTFAPFTLPAKKCDAQHWITIRTSASDSALPPEGTRVTPCYANVASLPARPRYTCSSPKSVLARVELKSGAGAITLANGANHYRLIGLEVTRTPGTGVTYGLIRFEDGVDHIVIDRCWVHGSLLDETARGVYLGGSTYVAVVDSYFNDFHCIAMTGTCTDAQAVTGGNSRVPVGVYKIVGNFLEAAAENIIFGGAPGATVPADIEIRRNYMFKPLTWMPSSSDFIGTRFISKNLFELKNGERVLCEGNLLENSWGGFSQVGYGILLTPRGEWAAVQDVTIRYNYVTGTGSGIGLAASQTAQRADSLAAQRWSIHDDILDDLDSRHYNGDGIVFQISSELAKRPPLNNITIDHVTVVARGPVKSAVIVGVHPANPRLPFNINFTNNILPGGKYSVWSTGGNNGCAKSGQPETTFKNCWINSEVSHNVIVDYPAGQGPWPKNNFLAKGMRSVGFTSESAETANYQLVSSSPYKRKASDGKDVGADVEAVKTAIEGVR